jgi:hypothetical protein
MFIAAATRLVDPVTRIVVVWDAYDRLTPAPYIKNGASDRHFMKPRL